MIRRFDFKTPECEDDDTETKLYTKADVNVRKEAGKKSRIIKIVYLIIRLFLSGCIVSFIVTFMVKQIDVIYEK